MDVGFKQKQLKPGDPGFEYDKRQSFNPPDVENSWDEGVVSQDDEDDYFEDDFV